MRTKIIGTILALVVVGILPIIAYADSNITVGDGANGRVFHNSVWIDRQTVYVFSAASSTALVYVKSTNGGASWNSPVKIDFVTPLLGYAIASYDVWFEPWSTGPFSSFIHIAWRYRSTSSPQSHLAYNRLNTSNDTFLKTCNVAADCDIATSNSDNAVGTCNWQARCVSITKDNGGNLYIKTVFGFFRSTDNGSVWTTRTNLANDPPWALAPSNLIGYIYAVGSDPGGTSFKIYAYDDIANSWSGIATISPARNPAYDFKGWSITASGSTGRTYVGVANGTTFRIFQINDNAGNPIVSELASVSGYSANVNDTDLAFDYTNDDLYALFNDGSSIKYQQSIDAGISWNSELIVTSTNVATMRVPSVLLAQANRFMPVFLSGGFWARNLNLLLVRIVEEPEDIDNWFIHFLGIFRINDSNSRTLAAGALIIGLIAGLTIMRVWMILVLITTIAFSAGLSQIRVPDGSNVIEPWIILVAIVAGGMAVIYRLITSGGDSE